MSILARVHVIMGFFDLAYSMFGGLFNVTSTFDHNVAALYAHPVAPKGYQNNTAHNLHSTGIIAPLAHQWMVISMPQFVVVWQLIMSLLIIVFVATGLVKVESDGLFAYGLTIAHGVVVLFSLASVAHYVSDLYAIRMRSNRGSTKAMINSANGPHFDYKQYTKNLGIQEGSEDHTRLWTHLAVDTEKINALSMMYYNLKTDMDQFIVQYADEISDAVMYTKWIEAVRERNGLANSASVPHAK